LLLIESVLLWISYLGIVVYLVNPRWMAWSSFEFPTLFSWLGTIIGIASVGLLFWSHLALGENFFGGVKLRMDHRLVTSGPYQWIRHPMYLSFLLLGFAWYLLSGNWLFSLLWIGAAVLAIVTKMEQEEAMLFAEFGQEYKNYALETPRLAPAVLTDFVDDLLDRIL
jgi:protein-S-isoprenylcysteine O-methyltransferase Ste14